MSRSDEPILDFIIHNGQLDPSVVTGKSIYPSRISIQLTATKSCRDTLRLSPQRATASAFGPKLAG